MNDILLETLEKSIQNDQFVVEKLKREYRKIDPIEAFKYLGNSEAISRIKKDTLGRLSILDVKIIKANYGDSQDDYYLSSSGYLSDTDSLTSDLFVKEWFVKL